MEELPLDASVTEPTYRQEPPACEEESSRDLWRLLKLSWLGECKGGMMSAPGGDD